MSNKVITKNDLAAVLNEVLPPTPSEYKKLLWTNPSPTSSFAAQTIPLDLSNYDAIEIIIRSDTANTYTLAPIVTEVGKGGIAFNSTAYNSGRQFTTTTSGITFTGATYYSAYGNWSTTSTNALIPVKIYGIKYERVLPPAMDALEWKLKGTASGNTAVDMPTDYNEIMLVATGYSTFYFTVIVPKADISSSIIYPRFAFIYSASNYCGGYFKVNNSTANLDMLMDSGTNRLSSATFKLYYR